MDWTDCPLVEVVPGKVSGQPVIRGSRVQAETVRESAELGETPAEIAYNYDLNVNDVLGVLAYVERQKAFTL